MVCEHCNYDNKPGARFCEFCGEALGPAGRGTSVDASGRTPVNAGQKRRTVYDPGQAESPAGRCLDPDPFGAPLPPRAQVDPEDPFRRAAPARARAPTIVEPAAGASSLRRVVGVLVEYRSADDPGRVHPLVEGRTTIGRDPGNDVVVDDGRVSGQHGFLFLLPDRATFVDVSTNGSVVDDHPLHGGQAPIEAGSRLRLGAVTLVLLVVPRGVFEAVEGG